MKKDEEEDSSGEEGQAFYAGGPTAGQQILGPKKNKNDIKSVFSKAKEHGAEIVDKTEFEKQRKQKGGKQKAFGGQAYRLGDSAGPSELIGGSTNEEATGRQVDAVLTFWSNGFTVNNGPLRDPAEPANALFLAQIKRGQVPKELIQEAKGSMVNLILEDSSQQEYTPPKMKMTPFGGTGHRLGSPATVLEASSASNAQVESNVDKPQDDTQQDKKESAKSNVAVDDAKPITSIQIRLPDGSREVLKLNHSHTVGDIRSYIVNTRQELAARQFILLSSFPRLELTEESKTLAEANLINSLVIVKLS